MAAIVLPFQFAAGSLAAASEVNSNLNTIVGALNRGLGSDNLAANSVGSSQLQDNSVTTSKFANSTVTNVKVAANAAIALSKLATTTASRALVTSSAGVITVSAVTASELSRMSGIRSSVQGQIDALISGGVDMSAYYTKYDLNNSAGSGAVHWNNVTSKPTTATRWPTFGEVTGTKTVTWANVSSKPTTATRWPTFSEVTAKPSTSTRWPTWGEVTGKPDLSNASLLTSGTVPAARLTGLSSGYATSTVPVGGFTVIASTAGTFWWAGHTVTSPRMGYAQYISYNSNPWTIPTGNVLSGTYRVVGVIMVIVASVQTICLAQRIS